MIDFKKKLNPVQYKAVTYLNGPLIIIAGAGSGKTRILTHRVAYLTSQGIRPNRILAVTFTNKAAGEMAHRVDELVNSFVPVSTFHSFCLRVLRTEYEHISFNRNFVVYDKSDQLTLIKDCMRRQGINEKHNKPKTFLSTICKAKNNLISAEGFAAKADNYEDEAVANVYREYEAALQKANAMDFDDLIMRCVKLLEENKDVREKYQNKYDHMLVDEFQDTNYAQYQLTKILSEKHQNICIVGDPDQSIYKFRGADINNILNFEKDFKKAHTILLEQNYRSTETILSAANNIISLNTERKDKKLWTENDAGDLLTLYKAADEYDEAQFIIEDIQNKLDKNPAFTLDDVVIFYRIHALSRVLEEELRKARISYNIVGDISFYSRREIKDIVAYLRVIVNSTDDIGFRRIINIPHRGIGSTTQEALARYARTCDSSLFEATLQADTAGILSSVAKKRIVAFNKLITKLKKAGEELMPTELINLVLDETKYIEKMCGSNDVQDRSRIENIRELVSAAAEYENSSPEERPTLEGFLQDISLISDLDAWNESSEAVALMTIHNAKGLEFPIVYIVGVEEDMFPHYNSLDNPSSIEEERRLCYVGMTRAEKHLALSCAYHRTIFGQRKVREPSRFLSEIPDEHINTQISGHRSKINEEEPQKSKIVTGKGSGQYVKGTRVSHTHFGKGKIESVVGTGESARLTIQFNSLPNPKVLVAKYAKLKVIK